MVYPARKIVGKLNHLHKAIRGILHALSTKYKPMNINISQDESSITITKADGTVLNFTNNALIPGMPVAPTQVVNAKAGEKIEIDVV